MSSTTRLGLYAEALATTVTGGSETVYPLTSTLASLSAAAVAKKNITKAITAVRPGGVTRAG